MVSALPPDEPFSNQKQPIYEESTQHKHWRFTPSTLALMRQNVNATAVTAIRAVLEDDIPGSLSEINFLTADDEYALVKLYTAKVGQLCGHWKFAEEVEATAITYVKRFYLRNTVMDWHPKNVMLTAIFLATKTTNHPIVLDHIIPDLPNTTASDILDLEFLLAQSLTFEFKVWHAHRSLWGLYLDLQALPDLSLENIKEAYYTAQMHVGTSRLTDAELIYPPSQIALAALYLASETLAKQYVDAKRLEKDTLDIVKTIADMIQTQGKLVNVEIVRGIDMRLKICKNPEKVPGTKAYQQRQAELEAKEAVKREQKALKAKLNEEDNPFGDNLPGNGDAEPHGIAAEAAKVDGVIMDISDSDSD